MGAFMQLGVGLNTGYPSFQIMVMIAMHSAYWVKAKVMHLLVQLQVPLSRHMQVTLLTLSVKKPGCLQCCLVIHLEGLLFSITLQIYNTENYQKWKTCTLAFMELCLFALYHLPVTVGWYGDISFPNLLLLISYQKLMRESSRMPLFDLRKLNASLPVPSVQDSVLKILVLGANDDFIVDAEGLNETGRFYGVPPVCIEGVAHDMMLDNSWEKGAKYVLSWLNGLK